MINQSSDRSHVLLMFFDIDRRYPILVFCLWWQHHRIAQVVKTFARIDMGLYKVREQRNPVQSRMQIRPDMLVMILRQQAPVQIGLQVMSAVIAIIEQEEIE